MFLLIGEINISSYRNCAVLCMCDCRNVKLPLTAHLQSPSAKVYNVLFYSTVTYSFIGQINLSTYCVTVLGSADEEVDLRDQVLVSVDIKPINKFNYFKQRITRRGSGEGLSSIRMVRKSHSWETKFERSTE